MPLPPYPFVPGQSPHPVSDPAGHLYGKPREKPEPFDPDHWEKNRDYLLGFDLFNHGYYWEAHEAWEGLWHACGRTGMAADFFKGLIKLAAAGVKVREGKPHGVISHAARAADLFWKIDQALGGHGVRYLGLPLHDLLRYTERISQQARSATRDAVSGGKVVLDYIVFDFILWPSRSGEEP
jgi:predicted metal-dependent hydrolase